MPGQKRKWGWIIKFFFLVIFFFIFSFPVFASGVVINEFSAITEGTTENPDWVEIYNLTDKEIDLNGWVIRDNTETNKIILSGFICSKSFRKFNFSNRLNNDGDTIKLFDKEGNLVDSVSYFSSEIPSHPKGGSTGRLPDGSSQWVVFSNPTPSDNECLVSTPSPTPTLGLMVTSPTATPPSFSKAFYKINEVKNKNGETISNVKIYVDGIYIHHYAPETLTFCEGCKCDTYVDCSFGSHLIELQKTGYQTWMEKIEVKAGDNLEVNPIMEKENVSAPLVTPTPTFVSSLSSNIPFLSPKSPSATPIFNTSTSNTPTQSGEILGENQQATYSFYPWESTEEGKIISTSSSEKSKNQKWIGILFLGGGFLILFGGGVYFWYTQIKNQNENDQGEN